MYELISKSKKLVFHLYCYFLLNIFSVLDIVNYYKRHNNKRKYKIIFDYCII